MTTPTLSEVFIDMPFSFQFFCRIYFFTKEFKDHLPLQHFTPLLAEFERQ